MKFALCIVTLLLLGQVCVAQTGQQIPTQQLQEELQIAIRRYMQCQADNVGSYNDQMRIVIEKNEKLSATLDTVKKELEQEKSKTKGMAK